MSLLLRRCGIVAGCVVAVVLVVAIQAYTSPKEWEATATVQLKPLFVPGLIRPDSSLPTRSEAMAYELESASSQEFRDAMATTAPQLDSFTVEPGDAEGTIRFSVRAESAERAVSSAWTVAGSYLAGGRASPALARAQALQAQLDAMELPLPGTPVDPDEPTVEELQSQIEASMAAVTEIEGQTSSIVEAPEAPTDPVSPDLELRLVLAVAVGLGLGAVLAFVAERRRPRPGATGDREDVADGGTVVLAGPKRAVLAGVGGLLTLVLLAAVGSGIVSLWELRPSTDLYSEHLYDCLELWLEPIPDGTVVAFTPESDDFFENHYTEFAFPRLVIPEVGEQPDVLLNAVPGPGPEACGNFHLERQEL